MWGALLSAELVRRGRSGQTHRLRVGWALALYGVLFGLYAAGHWSMGVEASEIGPFVMDQLRDGQVLVGCALGAALGAQGLIRDRLRGALDLVALTRMGPVQRWVERTAAHQLTLLGLVLLSAPALATLAAWGGVSPVEIALTVGGSLVSVALSGAVASVLALATDRALWAWLGAMLWGWLVLIAGPSGLAHLEVSATHGLTRFVDPEPTPLRVLSPVWAGALGTEPADGLGLLLGLVLLVLITVRGGWLLQRLGGVRRPWARLLTLAATLLAIAALTQLPHLPDAVLRPLSLPGLPDPILAPALAAAAASVAAGLLLLDGLLAVFRLHRPGRGRRRPLLGPWLDRELRAGAHGGASALGWWLAGTVAIVALQGWWSLPPTSTRLSDLPWVAAIAMVGFILTLLSALFSTRDDRLAGAGLALARHGPRRLVLARLVGTGVRSLPFLGVAAGLHDLSLLAWAPSFWLLTTLCALSVGWGIRRDGAAWALTLGLAGLVAVALGQSTLWGDTGSDVQAFFAPLLADAVPPTSWLLASAALYLGLAVVPVTVLAWRLRAWLGRR